ncbi:blue copper protein [Brachypodium distachyon]|uniref:Phytocyanin domain-containing protein n=1 Tax=Brachypodium distachyon TaxID=15368 RepID=A0A0Q3NEX3_BRADI|nr:blue copper protein [Brachypodium distachyon]KQK15878.1 hypothetical protein BRADI_1g25480v3 [Brachypodium distachyon]|eukprot:XP_010237365.1 blue copper protein [Brachypodium distachyon]
MKSSCGAFLAAMAVAAALATTALAVDYTVDDSIGWDTYVDYDKWTAGKTFMIGDTLTFKYEAYHNVLEVTEADYGSCATGKPISTHSGGETVFELAEAGTRYFICGIPRHCANGTMHLQVTTVPYDAALAAKIKADAAAAAAPSPSPLPSPPADTFADAAARSAPAGGPTKATIPAPGTSGSVSLTSAPPRYHVAGLLALAALVAMAA